MFRCILILIQLMFFTELKVLKADEYPYLYRSAYFLGRGDTGLATADEEEAIFYNPAGLALGKGIYKKIILASPMLEVSKDTRDVIKQIQLQESDPTETLRKHEGKAQHVGANTFTGIILRRAAIGVFAHSSNTAMLYKDHEKGALESLFAESIVDAGATFSLAQDFGKYFYLGTTAKFIKRNRAYFKANATEGDQLESLDSQDKISMTGSGVGADVGMMFRSTGRTIIAVGLVVQDIGNTTLIPDQSTDLPKSERPLKDIRQTVNIGLAMEPGTKYSKFRILADFRDATDAYKMSVFKRIHLGAELTLRNVVGFTTGLNQGYPTFGAYVDLRLFRFDAGVYGEEIGEFAGSRPDTRFYVKFTAGL